MSWARGISRSPITRAGSLWRMLFAPARLREQRIQIDRIARRRRGNTLLKGIEVDILDDSALGFAGRRACGTRLGGGIASLQFAWQSHGGDLGEVLHVAHEGEWVMDVNSQPDRLDLTDTACWLPSART
ncbi:MAG: hypothetical protein JO121_07975 [Deltaproteobacteria bacterium]|nr:hypothetical protein [Deltaproteobacteria bacterium]